MSRSTHLLSVAAGCLYLFVYAPIAVVIVYSFNAARFGADWEGFTWQWYATLFENRQALDAALNTILLALSSTAIATVLGTMLGYALSRFSIPGGRWVSQVLHLPVFVPDIVMGISLLMFYSMVRNWIGWPHLGMSAMIMAHVTFQIPFVAIVVRARMAGLDPALEEAAHDLGADARQAFFRVTLPLLMPGIVAAALLAFTLSLDDFVVSFFTTGPGATTLPILIYSSVKRGISPDINALSTLIIAASIVTTVVITLIQRRER